MSRKENICSRTQVERYLLNKMSSEEEFLLRQHLEECNDCRKYLNSIRALSGFVGDENMQVFAADEQPKGRKIQMRPLYRWISAAASVLIIVGISIYFFIGNSGGRIDITPIIAGKTDSTGIQPSENEGFTPVLSNAGEKRDIPEEKAKPNEETPALHNLHIEHQHRASVDETEAPAELLFPDKTIVSVNPADKPISFKWNKETNYHLILISGNDTIVNVQGTGIGYTPGTDAVVNRKSLDWTLILDGKETKGRIFVVK